MGNAKENLGAYTNVTFPYDPNGFVSEMISAQKIWQE